MVFWLSSKGFEPSSGSGSGSRIEALRSTVSTCPGYSSEFICQSKSCDEKGEKRTFDRMGCTLPFSELPSCLFLPGRLLFCFLATKFSDSLVVVVNCYTGNLLCFVLTDNEFIQVLF
jgi:hypothetical protein